MIEKINSLTKIFIKGSYQNIRIFNKKNRKFEKKSTLFWFIVIIAVAIFYVSYKIINILTKVGQEELFFNIYFLILAILLTFQCILISTNIYFFSKDIEYILPLPVSPIELLLAKFNSVLSITYITELIFALIPLIIYGLMAHMLIKYFILIFIVLFLFPILIVTIISIITIFLMNFSKFIKSENILQNIITFSLVIIMFLIELLIMNNISDINNYSREISNEGYVVDGKFIKSQYDELTNTFLIINPSIEILNSESGFLNVIFNILKLIIYSMITILLFLIVGRKNYIRNILRFSVKFKKRKRNRKKINMETRKERNIALEYIRKEIKNLFRNSIFFIQTVLPVIILIVSIINIGVFVISVINLAAESDSQIRDTLNNISFDFEMICVILSALQVLFSISGISLTAVSREGRDAIFIKYIPIDLYKQFIYKNVLQVLLDIMIAIAVLWILYYLLPVIGIGNIILLFIISMFMNLINSYLMLIVDIRRPNLNWDSEYDVVKKNPNKIFQYGFMIIMIIILLYMSKLFKTFELNVVISLIIEIVVFLVVFLVIDIIVRKSKDKLFNNIN
ncbi:MAG: hypothetical protein HFJ40_08505 [Clostridia bacterium]|nr:hypothetical protein [Clostridia bacterium]